MAETKSEFQPIGDHQSDAFIQQLLMKKLPKLQDAAMAEMEGLRQEGVDTEGSPNPLTFMLMGMHEKFVETTGQTMDFESFVAKFRDKVGKVMTKRGIKPYSVLVGQPKVARPLSHKLAQGSMDIVKALVSPAWDGAVGTMRMAAAPLADNPENQDPAQREAIRRGLMPPLSEAERKKGQVEVLTGLVGAAGLGELGAGIGAFKAGATGRSGFGGLIKSALEGSLWGGTYSAAKATGEEQAAEDILEEAKGGALAGGLLVGGIGLAARGVGAGVARSKRIKLEKLMAAIDEEREAMARHAGDTIDPALRDLIPGSGLAAPSAPKMIPSNTQRFGSIDGLPDGVRETLGPDQVRFLSRADRILREKGIRLDFETGALAADPAAPNAVRPTLPGGPAQLPADGSPKWSHLQAQARVKTPAGPGERPPDLPNPQQEEGELGARLAYGDKAFFEREAEYNLLTPEQKGKIDFLTYLNKTEGTRGLTIARNLERSAKTRMRARQVENRGKLFDVTSAIGEGTASMTDLAVIGAAKLFRMAHLPPDVQRKLWSKEMTSLLGESAATQTNMVKVLEKSQVQLEKMLENMAPEMRDVRALMQKFEEGKPGMDWYTNAYKELVDMYGPEDAKLMSGLLAINSTGTNVRDNVSFALKDFARLKAGLAPKGGRFPKNQIPMTEKLLRGEPFGDQKVQNFYATLLGVSGHSTNDVQVSRALGWAREAFSKNQYRFVDEVVRGLAKEKGVTTEQYQAALWTQPKIAKAQVAHKAMDKKSMSYVGTFRPYHEDIKLRRADAGINNTLVVPGDEGGGGYTFNPKTLDKWSGKGYLATLFSEVVPEGKLTPGAVLRFIGHIKPLIEKHSGKGQEFTVGLWKQGDGTVSIDFNLVTPDQAKALAIGRRTDQYAIGDMTTGSYEGDIPTGKPRDEKQKLPKLAGVRKILKEVLAGAER